MSKKHQLGDAKAYHKNPRNITTDKLAALKKNLEELGDLGGIVHDLNSNEIIGGNQRTQILKGGIIVITETFAKPTKTGTVAIGYIKYKGETYSYRQVKWTAKQ